MRIARLSVVAGLAVSLCPAGELCGIHRRGAGMKASEAFEAIRSAVGFQQGTILLFASSDQKVKDRGGAASDECPASNGTERWIAYDPELIKGELALGFALAHEIAHHMNHDHLAGETLGKQQELAADMFAAEYLTRPPLNWTRDKLLQALSTLPIPREANSGYPGLEERRAQVLEGYRFESARQVQPATGAPPPKAVTTAASPAEAEAQQHFERGSQLGSMEDWDGDIREQQKAIALKPDYAEAHSQLGVALAWKGDWDGAIKEQREATRLKPDSHEAHYALGIAYWYKGKYDDAIREQQAAIKLKPDYAEAHKELGLAFGSKGNHDEEIKEQQTAIRLNPDFIDAHYRLGLALGWKKDWDGNLREQEKVIQLKWDHAEAHEQRGVSLSWKGDWIGYLLEEQEAVRLKPDNADAHRELGVALSRKGDWEGQIREEQEALRLNPNDAVAHHWLGVAFGKKANWDEQIKEEQAAIKLKPDYAEAHYQLGVALENKGSRQAALEEYRQAHTLDQNNTTYLGSFERLQTRLSQP